MHMNLTYLKRSACRMSTLVALAGTVPVAATAAPEPVAAKASTPAPAAAKASTPAPVATKASTPAPVATKASTPAPLAAKASTPAPVATKASTPAPVAAKASTPAPVAAKASTPAPAAAKASTPAPAAAKASTPAPVATKASTPAPLAAKAAPVRGTAKTSPVPLAAMASPSSYLVSVGESRVYRLERPIKRVAVGNPDVADFIMLNSSEFYLLGKKPGATNLIVWDQKGNFTSRPLHVSRNINSITDLLKVVLPNETDIQIFTSGPAVVLTGSVSNTLAAETAYRLVKAYLGGTVPGVNPESTLTNSGSAPGSAALPSTLGVANNAFAFSSATAASTPGSAAPAGIPGVVNLLKVRDPQQVRLEVRIAEVSKTYLESLGFSWTQSLGNTQGSLMTGFVSNATLNLLFKTNGVPNATIGNLLEVEALSQPGLIKILAEPTIVTMSGQEGYFLVGGKIYTPTVSSLGATDYVERTYGVGLRFTPTVLDAGRISLKVVPEVSEPDKKPVTAGTSSNLPAFKISTVSTTVQMNEGENLVIGGLMLDNLTEVIQAVPLLGEIPLLGALFRRTEKNSETTELMVIIRPTLVKASASAPELPTDRFVPPTRTELFIGGKLQGSRVK
jgi:pilus assembly protein CpaC